MSRINHARHAHRGRQTEAALPYASLRKGRGHVSAKPASAGRSLGSEEIAAYAAMMGITVSARKNPR